ncbi:Uu.00g075230.m01.CDS01 [Anthostomella pinea]|uniref:Uu.00g075230.m01.CDS01 n=1 Tax=Anthostomella pinea TaxID=933095 RepID=A0AAI8YP33_9PEZI|nr:Uu.00g075230.m01.CDS01 [Anthostomella pinea]
MKIVAHQLASALLAGTQWSSVAAAQGYNFTDEQLRNANRSLSIGYVSAAHTGEPSSSYPHQVLYTGFTMLDVFGPLELLWDISQTYNVTLSIIASEAGPVHSRSPAIHSPNGALVDTSPSLDVQAVATHTFASAPPLDVLVVPGGLGVYYLTEIGDTQIEDFIASRFATTEYVLSVCVGSGLLARAGVLAGRRATTNKSAWDTVVKYGRNVTWVPSARWVHDGKLWTSSGVQAGMDMMAAFLRHIYGDPVVSNAVNNDEFVPHVDPDWDPFAVLFDVPGANTNRSLVDCAGPLDSYPGYG